jgi:hypothetical protein
MDRQTLYRQDDRAAFIQAQTGRRHSPRLSLPRKKSWAVRHYAAIVIAVALAAAASTYFLFW